MKHFSLLAGLVSLGLLGIPAASLQAEEPPQRRILFASEGARKILIFAKDGSVEWEYPAEMSRDAWQLPGGNVLFCYNNEYQSKRHDNPSGVMEVTPDKKIVFHFQTTGQVWSCQRLADGCTLVGAASQGKLLIVRPDGKIDREIRLVNAPGHSCLRNARQIANGNFLVAEESARAVREYSPDGKLLREIKVDFTPYSAIRLANGNTIACGRTSMVEVDQKDQIVWSLAGSEIPEMGVRWFAGLQVLPQGNLLVCNAGGKVPIFEVNRRKQIVWRWPASGPTLLSGHGIQDLDQKQPNEPSCSVKATLAVEEQARLPIIVSERAGPETLAAAEDLSRCLKTMTSATFETQKTAVGSVPKTGIILGTLAEFPDGDLNKTLAVRPDRDGVESFVIRTEPGRVRLIGATDLAASHAAYRLLEELGCRWFFPAPEWEVIPKRPMPAVSLNVTERPKILSRRIWWGYGCFDKQCQSDYQAWSRRNRMAQSRKIQCGHAWQTIIASNRKTFDEHPEYLALVKGKRQEPQLCVSNPAVRALAVQYALDAFARDPGRDMVSMETSDGSDHCECPACAALGNISERAFGLANEAARAVAAKHRGKMVGMLAYNDHCEPPSFPLEPNVYVQSTAGFIRGRYTHEELTALWPKVCKNLGFYEYFSVWLWDFDMPPGGRGANVDYIRQRISRYAELGATSLDCESGNNWGLHGRGYVLANRLTWDPSADADAILADFYQTAFGPAAETMQRYYERLDPGRSPLVSEHLLGLALRDLDAASKQAADRADVLARLRHLKQYLHYVRLRWEFDRAVSDDAGRVAAEAVFTHAYRTRYSYMNHWAAIRQDWLRKAAEKYARPDWLKSPPWKDASPPDSEETERQFREDMERFQPVEISPREFSEDLVVAGLPCEKPAVLKQKFQLAGRYACLSRSGEPIEVSVTTGEIAWYRDRPAAVWRVSSSEGKEVASGKLPQDGEVHALKVPVPQAGLYWLDFDDQGAGWSITAEAGRPICLALNRESYARHLGQMQRVYFFVPRGTRRVDYFWNGGPHELLGPDGKVLAKVAARGTIVQTDVPENADGKAWSLAKLPPGQLWLFNCPNYLAASPDALLVPRETTRDK